MVVNCVFFKLENLTFSVFCCNKRNVFIILTHSSVIVALSSCIFQPLLLCLTIIYFLQKKNVAEELLKLGFASVQPIDFDLEKEKVYLKYYKSLLQLENKAEKQRLGMWASREYTLLEKVTDKIWGMISDVRWRIRGK